MVGAPDNGVLGGGDGEAAVRGKRKRGGGEIFDGGLAVSDPDVASRRKRSIPDAQIPVAEVLVRGEEAEFEGPVWAEDR